MLIYKNALDKIINNKTMTKVYFVEASSGSYDSHHTWIHAVYLKPQLAEEEKDRLNLEWEAKRNILPPFPVDEFGDLIDENLSEEEKNTYHTWWHNNYNAEEWNPAVVKEYEIGKIYNK
jgi:hypothetical protein